MTVDEQLEQWVAGKSIHNDERDECCPDFSCCEPKLLAPKKVRIAFQAANEETRMGILGHFLGASITLAADEPEKVYIAGQGLPQ